MIRALPSTLNNGLMQLAADIPNIKPDGNAPGAAAFTKLVGALMFYGGLGILAGIALSVIAMVLGRFGSYQASTAGRIGIFVCLGGGIVLGGAGALANWSFNLGASIGPTG